jgi:hypothetical protein
MIIAWVLTTLAWLAFVASVWAGSSPEKWPIFSRPIFAKVTLGVAIILNLRAIFWLPFRRHEKLAAELEASKPQPPKIKDLPPEQIIENEFERSTEAENESETSVPEPEAINKPQPSRIKAFPPEQTIENKFERLVEVENGSETLVPEFEAVNKPQTPKIKAFPPQQTRGNIFERLLEIENESKTLVAEPEAVNKPQPLKIKALPPAPTTDNKFECLFEVENESASKTAENVEVKLLEIDPIPKFASTEIDLPLHFPILLQAKSKKTGVINPKDSGRFVLFDVTQTLSEVVFEIVGVEHNLNTFFHGFWEWPPNYPFPNGEPPEVLEYRITISASSNRHALVKETFKLVCPSRWIHEKPFTLTKI